MAESIAAACEHLERQEAVKALETLIEAWREEPSPRLANLIDALGSHVSKLRIDARSHDAWLARARNVRPEDLGALLAALAAPTADETMLRLEALQPFGRDPRIASALVRFVGDARYPAYPSRPMWTAVFARLTELQDVRGLTDLPRVRATWATQSVAQRAWLEARAKRLVSMLEQCARTPRMPAHAHDAAALDALERAIAKLAPRHGIDDMLTQIYRNPDNDQLRLVYADQLQERGDPRGELLALQRQKERSLDVLAREKTLIQAHLSELVGALLPVLDDLGVPGSLEITRGFLTRCKVRFRNERDVRVYGSRAAWATVEHLRHTLADNLEGRRWHTWIDPAMKSLRDVDVFPESAANICSAPEPWLIERILWCPRSDGSNAAAERLLASTDKLPKLRVFEVMHVPALEWLPEARFAPQLSELRVLHAFRARDDVGPAIEAASKLTHLEHFGLGVDDNQELTFARDAKGLYSILAARVDPSQLWGLADALSQIPEGILTEVDIDADPRRKRNLDMQGFMRVREALTRHTLVRVNLFGRKR